MLRNERSLSITDMQNFIDEELKELNIEKIVESYGEELEDSMCNEFANLSNDGRYNDNYFLTVNLSRLENQYEKINEFYWLKQLPFYVSIEIKNNNEQNTLLLNTYMEYI